MNEHDQEHDENGLSIHRARGDEMRLLVSRISRDMEHGVISAIRIETDDHPPMVLLPLARHIALRNLERRLSEEEVNSEEAECRALGMLDGQPDA